VISENKSSNVGAAANVGNKAGISKNQIKKLEDELAAMEDRINGLKSEKAKVEAELHLPEIAADFEKVAALTAVYDGLEKQVLDLQQKHDSLFEEWLMLQEG
jgi:chromosome segregation ATPase